MRRIPNEKRGIHLEALPYSEPNQTVGFGIIGRREAQRPHLSGIDGWGEILSNYRRDR